jgi:hypothetical protein
MKCGQQSNAREIVKQTTQRLFHRRPTASPSMMHERASVGGPACCLTLGLATLFFFSRSSTFNRTFTLLNNGISTGSGSFSAFCAHSAFSLGAYSEADPTDDHPDTGCGAFLNDPASLRSRFLNDVVVRNARRDDESCQGSTKTARMGSLPSRSNPAWVQGPNVVDCLAVPSRRRGDRIEKPLCCDCSQPVMAEVLQKSKVAGLGIFRENTIREPIAYSDQTCRPRLSDQSHRPRLIPHSFGLQPSSCRNVAPPFDALAFSPSRLAPELCRQRRAQDSTIPPDSLARAGRDWLSVGHDGASQCALWQAPTVVGLHGACPSGWAQSGSACQRMR